jgi:hypothetical protein
MSTLVKLQEAYIPLVTTSTTSTTLSTFVEAKLSSFVSTKSSSFLVSKLSSIDNSSSLSTFSTSSNIGSGNVSSNVKDMCDKACCLVMATHASSPAMLGFLLPAVGMSVAERLRDRGYDVLVCFDDLSKHAKAYRQISLLLGKIPSRDAYPSDIFNVHSALLERAGKLRLDFFGGSITAFPVIETVNSDITEFIATNVISITDGQLYTNKNLFLEGTRPAIDSALSVSRIGSAAQMKMMKLLTIGIKNELTNLRISKDLGSLSVIDSQKLTSLEIIFSQPYLFIHSSEFTLLLLLIYKLNYFFTSSFDIQRFIYRATYLSLYLFYVMFLSKQNYSLSSYQFIKAILLTLL